MPSSLFCSQALKRLYNLRSLVLSILTVSLGVVGCDSPALSPLSLSFEFSSCLGSVNAESSCSSRVLQPLMQGEIGCWILSDLQQNRDQNRVYRSRMSWDGSSFSPAATPSLTSFPFSTGDEVNMTLVIFDTPEAASACDQLDLDRRCEDLEGCQALLSRDRVTLEAGREISFRDEFGSCRNELPALMTSEELEGDGVDNDCDGEIDESGISACIEGETVPCEEECRSGVKRCVGGAFGPCEIDLLSEPNLSECVSECIPVSETCDGQDNDCDTEIDEEVSPLLGDLQDGVCQGALQECNGARGWSEPDYQQITGYETSEQSCDGLDNDCDGTIDESCPSCVSIEETCDGLDNDCDGEVDEELSPPSGPLQQGVCMGALKVCAGLSGWVNPNYLEVAGYEVLEESCDGLDNDCDGVTDESCPGPCVPADEVCDGFNNDCDGEIDEALSQPLSTLQLGVCQGALQVCSGVSGWSDPGYSQVTEGYEASEQTCDGKDNDCDGQVDEGLEVFAPAAALTEGVCAARAQQECAGAQGWREPDYTQIATYQPEETFCDGLDNDCDGLIDEFCPVECIPFEEVCDGLDNDCDGGVDEEGVCPELIYERCRVSLAWGEINGNPPSNTWARFPPNGANSCQPGDNINDTSYSCDTASEDGGIRALSIGTGPVGEQDWLGVAWDCDLNDAEVTPDELAILTWAKQDCHVALAYHDIGNESSFTNLDISSCPGHSSYESPQVARCISTQVSGQYSAIEMEGVVNYDDWFGIGFYCDATEVAAVDNARAWLQVASSIQRGFVVYFATYQGNNLRVDGDPEWSATLSSEPIDNQGNARGAGSPISGFSAFQLDASYFGLILTDEKPLRAGNQFGIFTSLEER